MEIVKIQKELGIRFQNRLRTIWVQRAIVGQKSNFCLTLFGPHFGSSNYKIVVLNDVRNPSVDFFAAVIENEL